MIDRTCGTCVHFGDYGYCVEKCLDSERKVTYAKYEEGEKCEKCNSSNIKAVVTIDMEEKKVIDYICRDCWNRKPYTFISDEYWERKIREQETSLREIIEESELGGLHELEKWAVKAVKEVLEADKIHEIKRRTTYYKLAKIHSFLRREIKWNAVGGVESIYIPEDLKAVLMDK